MQYWKKINPDGSTNTVESHSYPHEVPDAIQITKEEYDEFTASLPVVEPTPPMSTHLATVDNFNPGALKPATVTRAWNGNLSTYDCFVTESVKDQWQAGDIVVGDSVLVHFFENDPDRAVVIAKVFETW